MNMQKRIGLYIASVLFCMVSPGSQAQSRPDWSGVWIAEGLTTDISGFTPQGSRFYRLFGLEAPWSEEGRKRFQANLENQQGLKAFGWGYPMMMDSSAPLQFFITPHETVIMNIYRDARVVHTDGRDHPPADDLWPTTWGNSVGRWEGDTLVIDTVAVRTPPKYFFSSPPLSEQAHYMERLRMTAPDRIEGRITIEDPVTLSEPWVVDLAYVRTKGMDRLIMDDYFNDRSEVENGNFTIVPPED